MGAAELEAIVIGLLSVGAILGGVTWLRARMAEDTSRVVNALLAVKVAMARREAHPAKPRREVGFRPRLRSEPPPPPESYAEPARALEDDGEDLDVVHVVTVEDGDGPRCWR